MSRTSGTTPGPAPPTSQQLADAFKPWVETCIELFGADRCMFESNFPVDKLFSSYDRIFDAFKAITVDFPTGDKRKLFHDNAEQFYRL